MIRNFCSKIFFFSISLLFFGCSRTNTDPLPAFFQVQEDVSCRTGETIDWNEKYVNCPEFESWLRNAIEDDLTLDQVVQIALLNNHRLKGTYHNLGIAQAQLVQSGLLKNPIFSLSIRYENLIHSANILEMGIVQNFLDIVLKPLKTKLATKELALVKSEVTAHVLDVIAEAKIAFYCLQAEEESLAIRKQVLEALENSYEVAQRLQKGGNTTKLDLISKRSNFEQMKIDVSRSEQSVVEARERLNVVMGLWGKNIDWKISKQFYEISDEEINFESIENQAIANSLDLQMSKEKMEITALSFGIKASEIIFPELYLGPDTEKDTGSPWFIGPQFSVGIPIFDTGLAQKALLCAELRKQWNDYAALAVEIRSAARLLSFRLMNASKQSLYFKNVILPLSKEVTEETLLQLNAMQMGVFDLLIIKQDELETNLKSICSLKEYWKARVELEILISGRMIHNLSRMN